MNHSRSRWPAATALNHVWADDFAFEIIGSARQFHLPSPEGAKERATPKFHIGGAMAGLITLRANFRVLLTSRGVAQPGSAPALGEEPFAPTAPIALTVVDCFQQLGESAFAQIDSPRPLAEKVLGQFCDRRSGKAARGIIRGAAHPQQRS
jgi:hypothetical protein